MTTLPAERRRPPFGQPDRLLKAREVAGLEQAELAAALDVSRQTISNYERGISRPRRLQLREWALVCGVDLDWLVEGDPAPVPGGEQLVFSGRRVKGRWRPEQDSNLQPTGSDRAAAA